MAARRVADENKKLRGLLAQHGVGDDTVEAYLQASPATESIIPGQYGHTSSAVQLLEQLLQVRKSCCADGNTGAPSNSGTISRHSSDSQSTVQSLWDPSHPQRSLQSARKLGSTHQYMTPSSGGSRASNASTGHSSNQSMGHYQRLTPVSMPRDSSPSTSNTGYNPHLYDLDTQLSLTQPYNNPATAHQHLQSPNLQQGSSVYTPVGRTNPNVNSCVYATDMISTMTGGDPIDVRADLGCVGGMECEVDNQHVFDIMDRYTGSGVGL
jgi:hypothetical protein